MQISPRRFDINPTDGHLSSEERLFVPKRERSRLQLQRHPCKGSGGAMRIATWFSVMVVAIFVGAGTAHAAVPPTPQSWYLEASLEASGTPSISATFGAPDRTGGTDYYLYTEVRDGVTHTLSSAYGVTVAMEPNQVHTSHMIVGPTQPSSGIYEIHQSVWVAQTTDDPSVGGRLLDDEVTYLSSY